jgi:lipopolysaccharide export system protein LptC
MSEQADRERRVKRRWARPGSSHDYLVRLLKFGLPALVGIVLAFLALVPLENRPEGSFLLDKNKVEMSQERMKVESAQYRGQDEIGRPFVLAARSAVQASSSDPVVEVSDMQARLNLDEGPASITAETARYNMNTARVAVTGPITVQGQDGYELRTRDVMVDLRDRSLWSEAPVEGRMPLGTFSGQRMSLDIPDRRVVLEGRARLHIVQDAFTKGR